MRCVALGVILIGSCIDAQEVEGTSITLRFLDLVKRSYEVLYARCDNIEGVLKRTNGELQQARKEIALLQAALGKECDDSEMQDRRIQDLEYGMASLLRQVELLKASRLVENERCVEERFEAPEATEVYTALNVAEETMDSDSSGDGFVLITQGKE